MNKNQCTDELMVQADKDEVIPGGTVVRRIGNGKDQQGFFTRYDDDGGMILVSIIDPTKGEFVSEAGILRLKKNDTLYRYKDNFTTGGAASRDALAVLTGWPLYSKNSALQSAMEQFVKTAYTPLQILHFKKQDTLQLLFVPLQQKFKIGRFEEKVDWNKVRKDLFRKALESMLPDEHITYLAQIPQTQSSSPLFYTAGTKPHYETDFCLKGEPFGFNPSHGGHILALKSSTSRKKFLVDAGSQYKGKGLTTPLSTAEDVTKALKKTFKDFDFQPVAGRGAFGPGQSY